MWLKNDAGQRLHRWKVKCMISSYKKAERSQRLPRDATTKVNKQTATPPPKIT